MDQEESVQGNREEDGYGGMDLDIYDAIVHFKKTGEYPPFADQKLNRNAHFHWRLRCQNFILSESNTLLYYNLSGHGDPVSEPRIVVKKGEARAAVKIVHERIGHVGQKQTHIAVAKRLYWRSIRRDTIRFVFECEICQKKKAIRNRVRESHTLPDAVELFVTSDPPPLSPSEALVADRLLLNTPNSFDQISADSKEILRLPSRQMFEYMDEDVDEFSEVVDDLDDEQGDVMQRDDYLRSVVGSDINGDDSPEDERSEEIIDPVNSVAPSSRKLFRESDSIRGVDHSSHRPVVNAPSRMLKTEAYATSSEGIREEVCEIESMERNAFDGAEGASTSHRSPFPTRPLKRSSNLMDDRTLSKEKKMSPHLAVDQRNSDFRSSPLRRSQMPANGDCCVSGPSRYVNYPSSQLSVSSLRRPQRLPAKGSHFTARRASVPYSVNRRVPSTYFSEPLTDSPLGAAGTIVSNDKDVIRLQKQVLLLQQEVYLMKRHYLQMKIDNFQFYQAQNMELLEPLDEEIVSPDEAPTVGGNEEVPADGTIGI